MNTFRKLNIIFVAFIAFGLGCTEQHDPRPHWKQFKKESQMANQEVPKLTEKGTIPGASDNVVDIGQKYQMFCSTCHGAAGDGQGPGGAALAVKARDFTDKTWQASVDDTHIQLVIEKGGPAAGLDASMAGWGAILTAEELQLMIQHVRDFAK